MGIIQVNITYKTHVKICRDSSEIKMGIDFRAATFDK